jgi:hypothetical protein
MPEWYGRSVVWGAMVVVGVIAYFLSLRGGSWLIFVAVTFLPLGAVLSIVVRRFSPIRLRLSGSLSMDLRGVRKRNP